MKKGGNLIDRYPQLPADARISAPDVKDASRLTNVPVGMPDVDYTVRSVYDSRPVNAIDVNLVLTANVVIGD